MFLKFYSHVLKMVCMKRIFYSFSKWSVPKLLLAFFFLPLGAYAQNSTIKGVVSDSENGESLIGASIYINAADQGTITDIDGSFTLDNVTLPVTIEISYTGYETQQILVENEDLLEIAMSTSSETLGEVLVIGYGKQEKRVATGAISKIGSENIEGVVVSDVTGALEGQVAGLLVNEASGQPGADKTILIRGVSTNGDNSPLFIVDGLQVGDINNLNPGDIESVDVLKDAASGAIYGARAANGVVIITTKKGKDDSKGQITYEGNFVNSNPWKLPEMLDAQEYVMITREKFANSNQTSALEQLNFPNVGDQLANNTDWMDVIFEPANVINHRLSANVKNAFISLDYWDQNGVIGGEKSNYKRYAVRLNSTKEINEYITIGENAYFNRNQNNNIGTNDAFGGVQIDAFAYDPLTAVRDPDQQYGFAQSEWVKKEYINPLSRLFLQNGDGKGDQFQGNVFLEIKPLEGLKFRTDAGIDASWWEFRNFTPSYQFHDAAFNLTNDVSQGYGNFEAIQWENYINYNKTFAGIHNFDAVVGTSYRQTRFREGGGSTSNIPDAVQFNENWQWLNAGQDSLDLTYGAAGVNYAIISYFGRVQYDYNKKYLFTATLRRDGSSNFGGNNRWGLFPSASVGWVLSKERFFNIAPISYMKLRASWGVNGSDRIDPLRYASRIENVFTYALGQQNQSLNTGAALATPPNPNVKWEESNQIDIGLEVELLEGKVTIDADVYQKTTKDLLMEERIPGYIGATNNPTSNLGEIRNRGFELAIGHRHRVNDLTITTRLSYTHFKNEVIDVAGDAGFLNGWGWPVRNTAITRMTEGFPVAHFVGYQTAGIFQTQAEVFSHINNEGDLLQPNASPGDLRFIDTNGDGIINSDDITDIGNPWPKHVIGLTTNIKYKGIYLSAIFNTQIGHDIYRTYERSDVTYTNYQDFWLDRWTPDNPSNDMPRLTANDPNNNQRPSDFYVEDGTFLRMRNLQIGYNLPTDLIEQFKMQEMKIYFTANNLFTITNYRGFDPDIGSGDWILDTGIDKGFYPHNQSFGGGLKVTF